MKTVYECDHCGMTLRNKRKMAEHESECAWNPTTKHCCTCDNLTMDGPYGNRCYERCDIEGNKNGGCHLHVAWRK